MNSEEQILEKIDLFLKGKMTSEEKSAFELEISNNKQLQEQVELSELINQIIVGKEALKIKEIIQSDLKKPKPNSGTLILTILLVIGTLLGTGILLINKRTIKKTTANSAALENELKAKVIQGDTSTPFIEKRMDKKIPYSNNNVTTKGRPNHNNSFNLKFNNEKKMASSNSEPEVVQDTFLRFEVNTIPFHSEKKDSHSISTHIADSCFNLLGEVDISTVPSCKDKETGEVRVNSQSVKGGTPPYSFSLNDKISSYYFDQLAPGQYTLTILDTKGCSKEVAKKVVINEVQCKMNQQYIFNPDLDNWWVIPFNKDKEAVSFKILDKSGKVFYQTSVNNYQPSEWNGVSNTGLFLNVGIYFYSIEYTDSTIEKGTILISK